MVLSQWLRGRRTRRPPNRQPRGARSRRLSLEPLEGRALLAVGVFNLTLSTAPTADLSEVGERATLPENPAWIDGWTTFYAEIWVSTAQSSTVGVDSAAVKVNYHAQHFTATDVEFGAGFNRDGQYEFDDAGRVTGIAATATESGIGDDRYALLARVKFVPDPETDSTPLVFHPDHIFAGPYSLGLGLTHTTMSLANGSGSHQVAAMPPTELWAVIYHHFSAQPQVGVPELLGVVRAFGETITAESPPEHRWADFDGDEFVGVPDLLGVVRNFGRSQPTNDIIYPETFPEAWRPPAPVVTAGLANDTAYEGTNDDGLTFDPTIAGQVTSGRPLQSLEVALGPDGPWAELPAATGSFTVTPFFLDTQFNGPLADGDYTVYVRARDQEDAESLATVSFALDRTPPKVTAVEPDSFVQEVPQEILVHFSEPLLNPGGIAPNQTFRIVSADGTATIYPTYHFEGDDLIRLGTDELTAGNWQLHVFRDDVADPAGNRLEAAGGTGPYAVFAFSVGETSPYVLAQRTPARAGPVVDRFEVLFSKPVREESFAGRVEILDASGEPISVENVVVDGATVTIHFTPQTAMGPYPVTIKPGILDLDGNAMLPEDEFHGVFNVDLSLYDGDGSLYPFDPQTAGLEYPLGVADQTAYRLTVDGKDYQLNGSGYTLADEGRTIVFPPQGVWDNTAVQREVYVPEDGGNFARIIDTFTNPTPSDVTRQVKISGELGALILIYDSSSGDTAFSTVDHWFGTDAGPEPAHLAHVVWGDGGLQPVSAKVQGNRFEWTFSLTVPGNGEAVRIMTFAVQASSQTAAAAEAHKLATLPPEGLAHLTPEEKTSIANFAIGSPQTLAGEPGPGADDALALYSVEVVAPLFDVAVARWAAVGLDSEGLALLRGAELAVAELGGGRLAFTSGSTITLDASASGWGWFLDPEPFSDDAFLPGPSGSTLRAVPGGPADGRVDLLTVLQHEMGHLLGLDDLYDETDDLMSALLEPGMRRVPTTAHVDAALAGLD